MNEKQKYDQAAYALIEWVEESMESGVAPPLIGALILEKALDLHFFGLGTEKAMEIVDAMMREKIREYGDEGLERN